MAHDYEMDGWAAPHRDDPELRSWAAATFRPAALKGNIEAYRTRYKDSIPTLYDRPPRARSFTAAELALLAATAIGLGAVAGLMWRKHRQAVAAGTPKRATGLHGLDVIGASR